MNLRHLIFTILAINTMAPGLHAQTWIGEGSGQQWSLGLNWQGDVPPSNDGTATVTFSSPESSSFSQVDAPWSIDALNFAAGTQANGIYGSGLTIGAGGITDSSTNVQSIGLGANGVNLSASQTWSVVSGGSLSLSTPVKAGANTLTFSGAGNASIPEYDSTGGLTMNGTGTLILGSNYTTNPTFSGPTQINSGTLEVVNITYSGQSVPNDSLGTSTVTLNGGTLSVEANGNYNATTNNIVVTADSTVSVGAYSGFASNTVSFGTVSVGTDTLTVTTNNSYQVEFGATTATGNATFLGGNTDGSDARLHLDALDVGSNSITITNFGNLQVGDLSLTGGSLSVTTGTSGISTNFFLTGNVTTNASQSTAQIIAPNVNFINGTLTIAQGTTTSGVDLNIGGLIQNNGTLTKDGAGTLEFSGDVENAGNFIINAGTVTIPNSSSAVFGRFTVNEGGILDYYGPSLSGGLSIAGGTVDLQSVGSAPASNIIWSSGELTDEADAFIPVTTLATGQHLVSDDVANIALTGTFTQTGGTYDVNFEHLIVDGVPGGQAAKYTLEDGTLNATDGGAFVGSTGSGMFNQTGGTANLAGLRLAYGSGSTGLYQLSSTGTLAVVNSYGPSNGLAYSEIIGEDGVGTFEQSGTSLNSVTNLLIVALDSGSGTSNYSLSENATLSAGSEEIGLGDTGYFFQTGGTNKLTSGTLYLGGGLLDFGGGTEEAYFGTGTYELGPGSLSASQEDVGDLGTGTFTQTGGSNAVGSGGLILGQNAGSTGTYTLSQTGSLTVSGDEVVGYDGTGAFVQKDSSTSVITGNLFVGGYLDSNQGIHSGNGSYELDGGSLSAANESIALYGQGTFTQTGGSNILTGTLTLGQNSGIGYTLNSSTAAASLQAPTEIIQGTFAQSGATTNTVTNLQIGAASGSSGYNLVGGTVSATTEVIGTGTNNGVFYQATGTNTISSGGSLTIGDHSIYELYGGVLNAPTTAGNFIVTAGGTFTLAQTGVENGYLQNFGTFNYYGGTFNGTLENDGTATFNGAFSAGAGLINNATLAVAASGSLYGAGSMGLDNEGEIDLATGTAGGASFLNDGLVSGYGTINGANFTNYGLLTQSGGNLTLSATGTNQNFANIDLALGRQFKLTGGDLLNEGTVNLGGGIVTGTATLHNSAGGLIVGPGTILAPFLNDAGGTVQLGAGTTSISHSFTNSGLISLASTTANLTGPGIDNVGTIQGLGSVGSTVLANNGIIEAEGGTLGLNGTVTNSSTGAIYAGAGDKVLVSNGLAANAGLINLTGGTYDNNGHALSNTGEISGYGTYRTGGLTTSGNVSLAGGNSTVNGAVTETAGTVNIYNPTTFTNAVTVNGGSFTTHQAQTDFAGGLTLNGGSFNNDPTTVQVNGNLTVNAPAGLTGGMDSLYQVSGNVSNNSTGFKLAAGGLELVAPGTNNTHTFTWSVNTGVEDIGTLTIDSGQKVDFENGGNTNAALAVLSFQLADGLGAANSTALQTDISTDLTGDLTIYYDPNTSADSYLDDKSYTFGDGGRLEAEAVPEPGTWTMLIIGLGMLIGLRVTRRRAIMKSPMTVLSPR